VASLRQRIGAWVAGKSATRGTSAPQRRSYASARSSRLTGGFGNSGTAGNSSADAELSLNLTQLRARSRQMVRDSAFAKRAKVVVVNNVIGSGVGMQAQVMNTRGDLRKDVNSSIEDAWCKWAMATNCHTGGKLHFHDLERAAMGQVFEAGEVFIRKHPERFGDSVVPLALELIESERLALPLVEPGAVVDNAEVRMGVEVDKFGRPIAYWIRERHPGDIRVRVGSTDRYERVPADQIFHLHIADRWPQTRGEPWMHTALRKLDDMNEATSSELAAVRASSAYFATIQTPESTNPIVDDEEEDGTPVMDIEPLTVQELKPGEELNFHSPNRPNSGLDAFMRHMQREAAAGMGVSYESLSRDYSQSNYSSSRLALLEDRDTWKVLQLWWIRNFRQPLHAVWMNQAVLAGAIQGVTASQYAVDMDRFQAVLFKPRGWSWIDPTKEVTAYKEAIKAGLTTITDVIAQTADGRDIEDVIETRKRELQMLADADIEVDTTVIDPLELAAAKVPAAPPSAPEAETPAPDENTPPGRVFSIAPKGLQ
jgi:lambda family phage portal protein